MRLIATTVLALFACQAWAQAPAPIGSVSSVDGLVTMSYGSEVATVQANTPVFDGARFIAGSGGKVELQLQSGCTVTLSANQYVSIDSSLSCAAQQAQVQTLSATALGGSSLQTPLALATAAALAAAAAKLKDAEITPRPQ